MPEPTLADDFRLPRNTKPVRYVLRLAPDLEQEDFEGAESLELEVFEATQSIVLNACDLTIEHATIEPGWGNPSGSADNASAATITMNSKFEQVTFTTASPLDPGRYTLSCKFRGRLNDKLCGLYKSTYVDNGGKLQTIATTQFEQTDARKAFPCFDEPDRKAIFDITLEVPSTMTAISNGEELSSSELGNGKRRVHFAETIPMSTYLVALIVGPLEATEPIDVNGVALRVYTVPGRLHLAGHALEAGAHALRFFTNYFDIPYPGTKLDLVALPDFASGAMENLGCVTFREAILLADPENVSRTEMESLVEVVEHEIAHMWFGDLVTMRWWNGIWLNEAFATFMSRLCQDDLHPEWNTFVSFSRSKSAAFHVDALHATRPVEFPVNHPDEAAAMFDVLTYEKGASILWMIEQYLGPDKFRDGVRRYLKSHIYANTESDDLWDAIESASDDAPVRAIMNSWIFQGGFPSVELCPKPGESPTVFELSQTPFSYLPAIENGESAIGRDWLVPIIAAPLGQHGQESHALLGTNAFHITVDKGPLLVNVGGSGFFRVKYDRASYSELLQDIAQLRDIERFNLADDTWAYILAGRSDLVQLAELAAALHDERDPFVWSVIIGAIETINTLIAPSRGAELASFTRELLGPVLTQTGWKISTDDKESTPLLRSSLIASLGGAGQDLTVIAHCRELFDREHLGGVPMDADLAGSVLGVVAGHSDDTVFEQILARFRNPQNPSDQIRHLSAFAKLSDPLLAQKIHELCLTEIRSQDAPYLLRQMLRNRKINLQTWRFITDNFAELRRRFPDNSIQRMLEGLSALAQLDESGEPLLAGEVEAFGLKVADVSELKLVEQTLERRAINIRLARRLQNERFTVAGQFNPGA
ncbi:MAG TPA: M1 family aminopeptidase [Acidimicrobiales bacterium]|nr:M1 family aminopeptidase [Acidimicrobiales bacterium]